MINLAEDNNNSFSFNTDEDKIPTVESSPALTSPNLNKLVHKKKKLTKDFYCSYEGCAKRFEYKWILDRHINSHFCFKLFKCSFECCSKAYKSKENLNLHVKNKHLNIKPYSCDFCNSRFSHRNGNYPKKSIKI
jgi:hypothetical protein